MAVFLSQVLVTRGSTEVSYRELSTIQATLAMYHQK